MDYIKINNVYYRLRGSILEEFISELDNDSTRPWETDNTSKWKSVMDIDNAYLSMINTSFNTTFKRIRGGIIVLEEDFPDISTDQHVENWLNKLFDQSEFRKFDDFEDFSKYLGGSKYSTDLDPNQILQLERLFFKINYKSQV